jgi:hypothetical protein
VNEANEPQRREAAAMMNHELNGVVELTFSKRRADTGNTLDPVPSVRFSGPSGGEHTVLAFSAGPESWKVRFSPDRTGSWRWSLKPEMDEVAPADGEFRVSEASSDNPWRTHGHLTIHRSRRAFAHADGTPVFWLADTVWAAPAHATLEEWKQYLQHRRAQGFNIVQINALPQWDASGSAHREPFLTSDGKEDLTRPDPAYFSFLDKIVSSAAEAGLLSAIVVVWFDNTPADNEDWPIKVPRRGPFTDATVRAFARYLVARYEAFGVVWIASGDSGFRSPASVALYDAAAEAIVAASARPPMITAHLNGATAPSVELNARNWLDFIVYQSCHFRDSADRARRYSAIARSFVPRRPVVNSEPCYDSLNIMDADNTEKRRFGRADVRRTSWVSLLSGAGAGISYGAHGLWPWHRDGQAYGPIHYGMPLDWRRALTLESGEDLALLRRFFERLPWWENEPAAGLTADRPDAILGSATVGDETLVTYIAGQASVSVPVRIAVAASAEWFDPTTGETVSARLQKNERSAVFTTPFGDRDAVLVLKGDLSGA